MPRFDFINRRGQTLTGRLELPKSIPTAFAIFAHCFTCSKNVKAATQVSKRLAERGIAVLRFDFTGLGNSEGDFANSNFSSNVSDLIDAAVALGKEHEAPTLLIGHSLGGAAALLAAAEVDSVRTVATIGAPSEPAHVEQLIKETTTATHADGSTTIVLGGRELRLAREFVDDLKSNRLLDTLPALRKPLLIFHSPSDSIVSVDHARRIYEGARHPKSFISIDHADHMLSEPSDARFVAETLAAWASRYLPSPKVEENQVVPKTSEDIVDVREVNRNYTQVVQASGHQLYADEPVALGGNDTGPNPYDLLLASLGTCTSMTLRMYADRKQWPLESIKVRLHHSRIHAEDCRSCEAETGLIDRIEKEILVTGDLNEDQLIRLTEIADRCPVHKTLMNEKDIVTNLQRV